MVEINPNKSPQISHKYAEATKNALIKELRSINEKLDKLIDLEIAKKEARESTEKDAKAFTELFEDVAKDAKADYQLRKTQMDEFNHARK